MKFNNNSQRILRFSYKGRPTKAKETVAVEFLESRDRNKFSQLAKQRPFQRQFKWCV